MICQHLPENLTADQEQRRLFVSPARYNVEDRLYPPIIFGPTSELRNSEQYTRELLRPERYTAYATVHQRRLSFHMVHR